MNRPLNVEIESCLSGGHLLAVMRRFAIVAFMWISLSGLTASETLGQTTPITVSAVPASLALQPGRVDTAVFVVRNTSATAVRNVRLSWFNNSHIDVTAADSGARAVTQLPPGSSLAIRVNIVARDQSKRQGSVILRADFTNSSGGVSSEFGSLAVSSDSVDRAEGIIEAQISASLKTVTEKQPGQLYLILKNKSDVSVNVDSLEVRTPSFLVADSLPPPFSIDAREVTARKILLKASDRVRPGKHQVLIDLSTRWPGSGKDLRHLVLSREVDVGVEGESAILAAFGIPSFLVLPGFLMVVTFGALWKLGLFRPRTASRTFQVSPDKPEFWLLAITLSGLMAIVYPKLSDRRDYLELYGLRDVSTVWIASIFVGIIAYLPFAWYQRWQERRTPNGSDDPVTILEKLGIQKLGLLATPVTVGSDKAFALQAMPTDKTTIVVGPAIEWKWMGDPTKDLAIRRQIDDWIRTDKAVELGREFRRRMKAGSVVLAFKERTGSAISRPTKVESKDVKADGGREQILQKN